jgi:alpha-tubulin suppressor-like RCC1 family protein
MVSAGQAHTCSVTANSIAYCWGRNAFGEVGNNTQNPPSIPAAGVHIPAKVLGQP